VLLILYSTPGFVPCQLGLIFARLPSSVVSPPFARPRHRLRRL
jgi:hypothetical protein